MRVIDFLGRLNDRIRRRPLLFTGRIGLIVLGLPSVFLLPTNRLHHRRVAAAIGASVSTRAATTSAYPWPAWR